MLRRVSYPPNFQASPITANRYYIRDEYGEILMETDNYAMALRCKARYEIEDGKNVRLIDRKQDGD